MKILFLNYEYPPLGGGAAVATEAILREWAKDKKHEIHLVTSAVGRHREHIRLGGEVYIHRLPIGKNAKNLHSQSIRDILAYSLKACFFLVSFVRRQKKPFDVTLAFFTLPCGFLAYLLKVLFRIPFVTALRGSDVPGFSEKYDTFYVIVGPLVRFLWKRSAVVIPNSPGLETLARKTSPDQPMTIIENGVDTEHFVPAPESKTRERVVLLSTSRLTPRKRIDALIRVFAQATERTSRPLELRLIGDGEQRAELERLATELRMGDKVKFLGRYPHERLREAYQEADVFVLPSKNEGMSNSALEALASGLPLLVSGTGGMSQLVADEKNGFFIDPDDIAGFVETIVKLAEDQELREKLGKQSRERALTRSWSVVVAAFERELSRAASSRTV